RIEVGTPHGVLAAGQERVQTADIEEKELIKTLTANIAAKLDGVLANGLREIIRPLKSVAHLRQFSFEVVAYYKSSAHVNVRNTHAAWDIRGNTGLRIYRIAGEAHICGDCYAGILDTLKRVHRVIKIFLPFTKIVKAEFIH